jgi:hypothetical protein
MSSPKNFYQIPEDLSEIRKLRSELMQVKNKSQSERELFLQLTLKLIDLVSEEELDAGITSAANEFSRWAKAG